MRKVILILGLFLTITISAAASKSKVYVITYNKGHINKNTTVRRSPMQAPVEVSYDSDTRQVEVSGDEEMAAQVYLCDENGNTLDSANSVNAVLNVPETYSGLLIIRVENAEWIATGKIAI